MWYIIVGHPVFIYCTHFLLIWRDIVDLAVRPRSVDMETLLRGVDGMRLDDSVSSVSDLLDAEPGQDTLSQLLDSAQGLSCGPSHNSECCRQPPASIG